MGTSVQLEMGSMDNKREITLFKTPEMTVDIVDVWKTKSRGSIPRLDNSYEKLFVPASNVTRPKEDGCMNKIKVERAFKLREEETKGRQFNIITGISETEKKWIGSFKP
jgi:hypothetical protein